MSDATLRASGALAGGEAAGEEADDTIFADYVGSGPDGSASIHLLVEGAHCGGCVRRIERALNTENDVLDARMKPWYPEELFCDDDTAKLVESRWSEYFPGGQVEMGDSFQAHLD